MASDTGSGFSWEAVGNILVNGLGQVVDSEIMQEYQTNAPVPVTTQGAGQPLIQSGIPAPILMRGNTLLYVGAAAVLLVVVVLLVRK